MMTQIEINMMYISSFPDMQLNQTSLTFYLLAQRQAVLGRIVVVTIDVTILCL